MTTTRKGLRAQELVLCGIFSALIAVGAFLRVPVPLVPFTLQLFFVTMAGFVLGLLQMIFDGAYAWGWQSMLLDYLVAFTPLGLAGLFKGKKWGIFVGTVVGCFGRFVVHYISGVTIYKILAPTELLGMTFTSPSFYSLVYNGSYMLPNTLLALLFAVLLYAPMKKYILGQDLVR